MTNLYIAQEGVKGNGQTVAKKVGSVSIRYNNGKDCPNSIIEVDNYEGFGPTYTQRKEPKIFIHNLPDGGSDYVFTGTHQELVEKLTKRIESFPKAVNDGTQSKEEIFNAALNDRCKYESSKTLDSDVYLAVMDAMDTYAQKTQSLLETLFQISYEMGFQKFYSGNTMADMMAAIEMAQRFEQEHKDTDWDQEDWLSATSEFIEEEINKLKKEE